MDSLLQEVAETAGYLKSRGWLEAKVGIVLGTGLGSLIKEMAIEQSIAYQDLPHFPVATVESHKGELFLGKIGDGKLIAMQGRLHYYEGYSMEQITFPVRVLKALGIQYLLLSNAAGGINPDYRKGDLVLIEDHINLLPANPLRGLNDRAYGNRFVDMSQPYHQQLNKVLMDSAKELRIALKSGVYAAVMGPNLETRAEYRYLRTIGADMVGMSTVPEIIVANHVGLACSAISVITDECDPDHLKPVVLSEILEVAARADRVLSKLFKNAIMQL